jgi:DNA-binding response OmpR family regulator
MRVLLVGERREEQLARVLAHDGHDVLSVDAPEAVMRLSGVFDPEVVVFVGASCRELRRAVPAAGIIALVRGQDVEERIGALQAGADDCLASPWSDAELRARVRAMGRRRARVWRYSPATSPAASSPAAISPAAISPAAISPAAISPAAISPAATSPAAISPAATSSAAASPV